MPERTGTVSESAVGVGFGAGGCGRCTGGRAISRIGGRSTGRIWGRCRRKKWERKKERVGGSRCKSVERSWLQIREKGDWRRRRGVDGTLGLIQSQSINSQVPVTQSLTIVPAGTWRRAQRPC